ncbi:MAG: metal-dependent transcriptional regulator [Sphaerochaetaceae bacterium]
MNISISKKKYLVAIHTIATQNGMVRAIDLTRCLKISKPSVSIMLRQLEKDNLIQQYGCNNHRIGLTARGSSIADHLIEKYRILEQLLVRLDIPPSVAEVEVPAIEDSISEESFGKICRATIKE